MSTKIAIATLVILLVCLGGMVSTAQAQGPCTFETFTGTYVFYDRGASAIFPAPAPAPYLFHWAGYFAPFVTVGEVTMGPGGVGHGFYWVRVGSLNGGTDPVPVEVTITELNEDCTGKFQYQVSLPGISATVEERFVLFDNGRQFRSIPTSAGVPTNVWIGEGHRLSKPGEPLNTCGPQTSNGTYLMTAENILPVPDLPGSPLFENAMLLHLQVSMTGDFTGMLYEKLGPVGNIEVPISGTIAVNPDCSFSQTLNFEVHGVPRAVFIRGVYFNEGKELYALGIDDLGMGIKFSFARGQRIGP